MLTEQYTADAICRSVGLPSFAEHALPLPALRLVMMPLFDAEVCVTLRPPADGARLSVIALAEPFSRQPAPCRLSAWKENIAISALSFDECVVNFVAAAEADRERTGRMVSMDGMSVFNQMDFDMALAYFECAHAITNGTSPLSDGCLATVQNAKGDSCQ